MKSRRTWVWVLTAALLGAAPRAVEAVKIVKKDRPADEKVERERPRDRPAARLAEEFDVGEATVQELRAKGLGWGEVRHALAISRRSGQPVEEVMKLRDSGLGWGEIAKRYGFKLGEAARPAKPPETEEGGVRDAVGDKSRGRGKEREAEGRGKEGRGREGRGGPRK